MIIAQDLKDTAQPSVDAEASQRYLDQQDWIPSINSSVFRATTACNWALANVKGSEESLSELQETRIFQTNTFGGLTLEGIQTAALQPYTSTIWTVIGLYAEPSTNVTTPAIFGNPATTYIRTDLVYLPGGENERPVQRMTKEQAAVARRNRYMSGNEVLAGGPLRTYAYYFDGNRTDGALITGSRELVITPLSRTSRVLVGMSYLRTPAPITAMTDVIEFPQSMKRVLADWTLQYLSIKQGDGTTLNSTAQQDAAALFNLTAR